MYIKRKEVLKEMLQGDFYAMNSIEMYVISLIALRLTSTGVIVYLFVCLCVKVYLFGFKSHILISSKVEGLQLLR